MGETQAILLPQPKCEDCKHTVSSMPTEAAVSVGEGVQRPEASLGGFLGSLLFFLETGPSHQSGSSWCTQSWLASKS